MRAGLVALALLAAAGPARAHVFPGERSVVAQAEADALALLVTYRPASTTALRPVATRDARRAQLAAQALATLEPRLDGARLAGARAEVKLVEDPPGSGRPLVVVLIVASIPAGGHTFTLDVAEAVEPTDTRWLDRSGGRVVAHGPRPAGVPFQDRGRLVLTWR